MIDCSSATVDTSEQTNPADYQYDGSTSASFIARFTASNPVCDVEYSCIGPATFCPQAGSLVVQFNASTGEWQFQTTDKVTYPPGSHEIEIQGYIRDYQVSTSQTHKFILTLVDPCSLATVSVSANSQSDPPAHTYSESTSLTANYAVDDPTCSI